MSENSAEHLSCLMDGEFDSRGSRFLIRRLSGDRSLQATWRRYHVVRACLHKEAPVAVDLSARVAAALESESAIDFTPRPRWLKPLAGGAIAAAVAVVAVVGMMQRQPALEDGLDDVALAETPEFISRPSELDQYFTQPATPVSYSASDDDWPDRNRINAYVVRHNQMATGAGSTGFISYIPIVSERPPASSAARHVSEQAAATDAEQAAPLESNSE